MLRFFFVLACLSSSAVVEAREGLDDSGRCVNPCRLSGAEPCEPCPPSNTTGPQAVEAMQAYARELETYRDELAAYAAANPEYRSSARYSARNVRLGQSQTWIVAMRNYLTQYGPR